MKCPVCSAKRTKVYNSRKQSAGFDAELDTVIRYRECLTCMSRWRSLETFEALVSVEGESIRGERIRDGELHSVQATRKLSDAQVVAIRKGKAGGTSRNALAKVFGVTARHISRIVNGSRRSS